MSVKVMDGDNTITVQQGSVSIEAAKDITLLSTEGPITIENGGGMIELSDGKLSIRGSTVSIEGNSVAFTGQMAEMMGGGGGSASKTKAAAPTQAVAATPKVTATALNTPVAATTISQSTDSLVPKTEEITHDIHFLVQDISTGRSLENIPYKITLKSGKSVEGKTDERGLTEKISDASSTIASLEAPYYGNSSSSSNTDSGHETCYC